MMVSIIKSIFISDLRMSILKNMKGHDIKFCLLKYMYTGLYSTNYNRALYLENQQCWFEIF